ncbi:MAG: hypothetical protein ACK4J0_00870 [Candidatus Anstonellaceae archaeon]
MITVPGKILFYGQYAVLEKGFSAFSFAVLDKKNKGVSISFKLGQKRIISKQFGLNFEPKTFDNLVSYPYLFSEEYLKHINCWKKDVSLSLSNSSIFGTKKNKSGLGSSAAATVAIVKALFSAQGLEQEKHLDIIHKIAQYSYAAFSKKLGSGYDIATAAYCTSIEYKRFEPNFINDEKILDKKYFIDILNTNWPGLEVKPFSLPSDYSVLFFNILEGFTSTFSSIKTFYKFKEFNPELYFKLLKKQNDAEKNAFFFLLKKDSLKVRDYTHQAREYLNLLSFQAKKLSKDFDLVEPPVLTKLIEKAEELDGVIAGRCPGSGGKDGIAFLVDKNFSDSKKILKIGRELNIKLKEIKLKIV